ncbi:MAG: SDR family NAD(P)-dependent oxidoreductase [Eubacteriales bacterium]|nr:SDR family NAD(P)-dependent oxidoreductase [Eubacteriales bacterium]
MRLEKKKALITGSSRGLGKQIALDFAKEGADVCINYKSNREAAETVKKEIEAIGGKAVIFQADVSVAEQAEALVDFAIKELGRIDILVNNVGMLKECSIFDMTPEIWDEMHAVTLRSTVLVTRFAVNHMIGNGWGRIINIASSFSLPGTAGGFSHYGSAKSAIIGFTRSIGRELAPKNILVNCIAPGALNTDSYNNLKKETKDMILKVAPMKKVAEPFQISPTSVMLASDPEGSTYVGQVLSPNCGYYIG